MGVGRAEDALGCLPPLHVAWRGGSSSGESQMNGAEEKTLIFESRHPSPDANYYEIPSHPDISIPFEDIDGGLTFSL